MNDSGSSLPDGFEYRVHKNGDVHILHHGRPAATLRGKAAGEFIGKAASLDPPGAQQLMARVTGNYRRGNEKTARNHPRNRG